MVTTLRTLLARIYCVLLLALGGYCLFFPTAIRALLLKLISIGWAPQSSRFKAYAESNWYLLNVRFAGLGAIAMSVLVALTSIFGTETP
jgi:hypothetical protein